MSPETLSTTLSARLSFEPSVCPPISYQWLYSETKGKSVAPPLFWWLSLIGNLLLFTHATLQMQFHVSLVQTINGVISWRNLDLMKPSNRQKSFAFTLASWPPSPCWSLATLPFSPLSVRDSRLIETISWGSHLLGSIGIVLFSSRFLIQWWDAERSKKSELTPFFWWISLFGGLLSLLYFTRIDDPVNLIGPLSASSPTLEI